MRERVRQFKGRGRPGPGPILALLLCVCALPAAAAADGTTRPANDEETQPLIVRGLDEKGNSIHLMVGQTRLVNIRVPLKAVDVTQPEVVLAKVVTPKDIVLTGRRAGSSQLVVWDDDGHSQAVDIIVAADLGGLQGELRKVLPNVQVDVTNANGAIVLRGHVPSAQVAEQVVQVATPYAAKVINLMEISGGQQVTLQVRFAEVSRDATQALGVNFGIAGSNHQFGASVIGQVEPLGVAPGVTPGTLALGVPTPGQNVTAFGQFQAGATPFDIFVTAMRENNLLRVLAEPNLTVMSGSQASFLAGGEFPYPVPQSGSATGTGGTVITIDFKQFGVNLTFSPVVLGDGRIRLQVQPEVSDLDFTHSLQLNGFIVPAITSRRANTTVELREGETLALAGLLNSRVNATSTVTPLLGDLPIIGALFRSVRYERTETELVVLVTPRLASGMGPAQVPPMPGEHWRYPTEFELFWSRDLGGPMADTGHAPDGRRPPRFHGTYGFAPVTTASAK